MPISLHGRKVNGIQECDKYHSRYRPLLIGENLSIITEDDKLNLLKKVRRGDKSAIDIMILSHIRLAASIVNRYIGVYNFSYYADDLDSAAITGIVYAVNRVAKGSMSQHDNITGYIVKFIHNYVIDAINHSNTIRVPVRARKQKIEKLPKTIPVKDSQLDIEEFEIWETIEGLANSKMEKRILELKRKGYVDREIGEVLNVSRIKVRRLRNALFVRYLRKEDVK